MSPLFDMWTNEDTCRNKILAIDGYIPSPQFAEKNRELVRAFTSDHTPSRLMGWKQWDKCDKTVYFADGKKHHCICSKEIEKGRYVENVFNENVLLFGLCCYNAFIHARLNHITKQEYSKYCEYVGYKDLDTQTISNALVMCINKVRDLKEYRRSFGGFYRSSSPRLSSGSSSSDSDFVPIRSRVTRPSPIVTSESDTEEPATTSRVLPVEVIAHPLPQVPLEAKGVPPHTECPAPERRDEVAAEAQIEPIERPCDVEKALSSLEEVISDIEEIPAQAIPARVYGDEVSESEFLKILAVKRAGKIALTQTQKVADAAGVSVHKVRSFVLNFRTLVQKYKSAWQVTRPPETIISHSQPLASHVHVHLHGQVPVDCHVHLYFHP